METRIYLEISIYISISDIFGQNIEIFFERKHQIRQVQIWSYEFRRNQGF